MKIGSAWFRRYRLLPCLARLPRLPGKAMQDPKAAFSSLADGARLASNRWSIQQTTVLDLDTTNLFSDMRFGSAAAEVNSVQQDLDLVA